MIISESTLIAIFNDLFEGIIVLLLYTYLVGQKSFIRKDKLKSCLFIITHVFFALYIDTFFKSWLHVIIYFLFYMFVLGYLTKATLFSSLISTATIFVIFVFFETIVAIPSLIIFKNDLNSLLYSNIFQLLGSIIAKIMKLTFIYLLYNGKIKFINLDIFKRKSSIISLGLLQIFMFCLIFAIPFCRGVNIENKIIIYQSSAFILCFLTIIFGIIDFKEREKLLKDNYQFKIQQVNAKNMENVIGILRKNHHDIGNHLNTILAIANTGQPDTIERIKEYTGTLTHNLKLSYKSYDTGNDFINGLLAVKNNCTYEKGVKLEVDFETKLNLIDVSDQALTSIMSNIIDNAIQAIENEPDMEGKFISVSGYIENGKYNLSICNNGPAIPHQSLGRIFESGYSTRNNGSKEHGFGLYIVKQYVKENTGEISVSSSEDETEFLMKFPLKHNL